MENKTLLKIIPYLPYKLKVGQHRCGKIEPYLLYGVKYSEWAQEWCVNIDDSEHADYQSSYLKGVKPILKSIDHIDKEEFDSLGLSELEELGVDYIGGGIVYMVNKHGLDLDGEVHFLGTDKHLPTVPWDIMQVLIKNHYDVFGLIEQGLAYDYNELNI